ncbi:MAG: aminoacyl-tRNA hydrolase [Gammaproteobacteria bacterium]
MPSQIDLIVGLGNPGREYADTRHNAGFWFVDQLARQHGLEFHTEAKFYGSVCRISEDDHDCWLLKPNTFMNESGRSVAALAHFYRIPAERILIAHDEIDLPPGYVRLKEQGGHGGHNGLRDIIKHLSEDAFVRLRVGVGHPGDRDLVTPYVLGRATQAERDAIQTAIDDAMEVMPMVFEGDLQQAMNTLHAQPPHAPAEDVD